MNSRWKRERFSSSAARGAIVLLVFAWAAAALADAPAVELRGNRELTDEQLESLISVGVGRNPEALARRIQTAYIERGHLSVKIHVEKRDADSTVVLRIDEGEPTRYGGITVRGTARLDDAKAREVLGVRSGDRYLPQELRGRFQRVLEYYDAGGYPFAQVWVDSLVFDEASNTADLSIYIVEGRQETIGRVEFEGLDHTKKDLAVKLSGLHPGEPYDGERLRDSYLRLTSSGVFREVSYPTVRMSPDGKGVEALIKVVEPKGNNSISGAIGYADRQGTDDRVLSGLVRVDVANIGGSLRDLHARWKNDGQGRSETRLSYRERFFLGRRVGLGIALEQIGLDTLYTWQSVGLESSLPVGRLADGLVGLEIGGYADRNTFSEGDVSSTFRTRLAGGVTFVEGHEDRGAFLDFRTRHAYGRKKVSEREGGNGETISQYIFDAQIRATADAARNVHGAIEVVYRDIESSEEFVPLAEQFYIGGAATIRGYRENQFHGRRAGYVRSELRVGKSNRENGYLFIDGGYVLEESMSAAGDLSKNDEYPVGYGFGLRTESKVGNIDISFGVGDEISLRATKVHVILNRSF